MGNDIEKLKAYHQVESFLSKNTQRLLLNELGLENSNLDKRLPGLRIEDEFALILYFLDNCKHIISLDESTSVLTKDSYQNDYIIHLKNGEKMMIEVKSKPEKKFKISKNNLEKRIRFAQDMNLELYFALKLNGYWSLYHSKYIIANNYMIDYNLSINDSIFNEKLGSYFFLIPTGIKIESIYSKNTLNGIGINNEEYGKLISYKLFFQNNLIFEILPEDTDYLAHSMMIETWHDHISKNQKIEKLNDNETRITEINNEPFLTSDYQYFLSTIMHTVNEHYNRHHASSFLKSITSDENSFNKDILYLVLDNLIKLGIPIYKLKKDNKTQQQKSVSPAVKTHS